MSEKKTTKKLGKQASKTASAGAGSPIDFDLLARVVELMSRNDLNTVDVRDGDKRVILKRGTAAAPIQTFQAPAPVTQSNQSAAPSSPANPSSGLTDASEESGYHRITSPMVGTFYASPKPGEKAFVGVGTTVNEETDVCIVEAMKTFNNIKAECRGTIARILVQDGHPVEFGTALFLVKP